MKFCLLLFANQESRKQPTHFYLNLVHYIRAQDPRINTQRGTSENENKKIILPDQYCEMQFVYIIFTGRN